MNQNRPLSLLACLFLSACSSIDSTTVFDQQQAAYLLHQSHTMHPARQMIKLSLPDKNQWQRIDMSLGTVGTPIMLVPNNESRTQWHQSIRTEILSYENDRNATVNQLVQHEVTSAKRHCKMAKESILSANQNTIIYRIEMSGCDNEENQLQIGKAFSGSDAVYLLYYTAINGKVSQSQINKLSQTIKAARLV